MKKDKKRYRLCLQCIEDEKPKEESWGYGVKSLIRYRIGKKAKWENPMYGFYWKMGTVHTTNKVCPGCLYVLEHTVLAQEEVSENEC